MTSVTISVISVYIILTLKPIKSISNEKSKLFKPIYFISCAFICKIYNVSSLFSIKSSGQM